MPGQGRNAGGVVDSAIAIGERLDAGGFAVLAGLAGDHIGPADDTPPIPLEDERGPLVDVAGRFDCWIDPLLKDFHSVRTETPRQTHLGIGRK